MKDKTKDYFQSFVVALIFALFIRTFIIQAYKIPSRSMEDTLKVGDYLLVNKFIYGIKIPFTDTRILKFKNPKRKDIIVFVGPPEPKKDYIKRCIGLSNETIELKGGKVLINNSPLDEPYILGGGFMCELFSTFSNYDSTLISKNSYFMMGDNRNNSHDSRKWGFLPYSLIKGQAMVIYWPIWRIQIIR